MVPSHLKEGSLFTRTTSIETINIFEGTKIGSQLKQILGHQKL
jgi:hypothetical protein